MSYEKLKVFILLTLFCAGCPGTAPIGSPSIGVTNPPGGNNNNSSSSRISSGDDCEDKAKDHKCKKQCKTMYKRTDDWEECEELSPDDIEKILDVHDILEEADDRNLNGINSDDLEVYLDISPKGFSDLIREYRTSEAEDVLVWITENKNAAETLNEGSDNYSILEELLSKLYDFSESELEKPFTREIDERTPFEMAIDFSNDEAGEWFLNYIFDTDNDCNGDDERVTSACFTVICKIGNGFQKTSFINRWLNFRSFDSYIEEIIEEDINAGSDPMWSSSAINSVGDLSKGSYADKTWVGILCGGLL